MAVRVEQMLDKVLLFGLHAHDAHAAAVLSAVSVGRHPLDVTGIGNRYHAGMSGDQVGNIQIAVVESDFGTARIGMFISDFDQFSFNHFQTHFTAGQQGFQIGDKFGQFFIFRLDVFNRQSGQLVQAHFQDGADLLFGELEAGDQALGGGFAVSGIADDFHHFINIRQRQQQTFQDMRPGFSFLEFKYRPADDHFHAVVNICLQHLRQIHHARTVMVNHQHD